LKPDEYFKGPTKNRAIFLHFTAGGSNPISVIDSWERDNRGKVATHYVIGGRNLFTLSEEFDGDIIQCMPETGNYGWHLGIGNTALHRESIGIEICNWGPLTRQGEGKYYTWNKKRVVGMDYHTEIGQLNESFRGYSFYHKITVLQIESLYFLIKKLAKENDIDLEQGLKRFLKEQSPTQAFDFQPKVHSDEIKTGLFCHTNVSPKNKYGNYEKWDLFPQPEIIELINSL
jgi:N-acetyl-anhydromuramyl-L-alanine amidase AmpD